MPEMTPGVPQTDTGHSERHPIKFRSGIHSGPIAGMLDLGLHNHGLSIEGIPLSPETFDQLSSDFKDPEQEVELRAQSGDPQRDRDVVQIAKHHLWRGRPVWPNAPGELPPDKINQAANSLRVQEGIPQEGPTVIDPARMKQATPVNVKIDMTKSSKWEVYALGEQQLDGGVGATLDQHNPAIDGPNPNGPDFSDNAGNSFEQEVALETWVNMAVDMLNRGAGEDEVLAQLAHDGCPDAQSALQRAMEQGMQQQEPVGQELGGDPLIPPGSDQPVEDSAMNLPQNVNARVIVGGQHGTELERYEDMWGQGVVRIALDDGRTVEAEPLHVKPLAEIEQADDPLSEIQSFIDSFPEVQPTRPSIQARIKNLEEAHKMIRQAYANGLSFSEQVKLDQVELDVRLALSGAKIAARDVNPSRADWRYLNDQQRFKVNAFNFEPDYSKVEEELHYTPFTGSVSEAAEIWAAESHWATDDNMQAFQEAALEYAASIGMNGKQIKAFLPLASKYIRPLADDHRKVRTEEFAIADEPAELEMNDGPAEALFN